MVTITTLSETQQLRRRLKLHLHSTFPSRHISRKSFFPVIMCMAIYVIMICMSMSSIKHISYTNWPKHNKKHCIFKTIFLKNQFFFSLLRTKHCCFLDELNSCNFKCSYLSPLRRGITILEYYTGISLKCFFF